MKAPGRDGARTTRPLTLGVLVDRLHGDYQTAVIGGVADAASEAATPLSPAYFAGEAEALIRTADAALYRAKGQGGERLQGGEPIAWPTLPR